jgi:hypothetical protein
MDAHARDLRLGDRGFGWRQTGGAPAAPTAAEVRNDLRFTPLYLM